MKYKGENRKSVLFIGGPRDGEWEVVDTALPVYYVAEAPQTPSWKVNPEAIVEVKHHAYHFRAIVSEKSDMVTLALHESCAYEAPLKLLLEGYRRA